MTERPFVGRERELAALSRALARAGGGTGGCVLLAGEPGIGKSTVVDRAVAGVPPERVLWGRCHEGERAPAYWPWLQVLRAYLRRASGERLRTALGGGAADLVRLLPALRDRLPDIAEPQPLDPEQARFLLFDAMGGFLARAGEGELLVVVLDDLHWADRDSLLLLQHVASELRAEPVLVLATYREAEMRALPGGPRLLGDLVRVCERVTLDGLTEPEVARLVAAVTGEEPAPALVAQLHRATDGNPYFVAEVAEVLRAEGRLAGATFSAEEPFRIPDTVREALRRRLDPLAPEVLRLLGVAAVLGPEVELAVVGAITETPPDQILARLEPALDLGLLLPVAGRRGRYRLAHALLRNALLDELPPPARAELHLRAGEALERLYALDPRPLLGEIAHHFFRAASIGGRERAIDYAYRAGRRALDALAFEDAAGHLSRAVEAQRAVGGDPRTLAKLLLWHGVALRRTGAEEAARSTLLQAARLARDAGDVTTLARSALNLVAARAETGVVDHELVALLEDSLGLLDDGDSALRAYVLGALARCLYFSDQEERRETLSVEALATARRADDPSAIAATLVDRHFVLWGPGGSATRLELATEMLALAERAGSRETECEARLWRIVDLAELGEMAEARAELARYALTADHLRLPRFRWHATVVRAAFALFAGDVDEAEALAVQAVGLRQASTVNNTAQFFAAQMFHVRRAQGRLAEIEGAMAEFVGRAGPLPIWRCGLALLEAELGRPEAARRVLDEVVQPDLPLLPRDANYLSALAALAEACALTGDARAAAHVHEALAPYADVNVVNGTAIVLLGPVRRYLGEAALAAGRLDDAVAELERAVATCAALGARLHLARARAALARALAARGAPGDAERAAELHGAASVSPPRAGSSATAAAQPAAERTGVLLREGDFWTISLGDEMTRLKGTKGLTYLATLLRHPGEEVHALELESGEPQGEARPRAGDAGEALDAEARAAYRRRLAQLAGEIAAAGDAAAGDALRREHAALERELSHGIGLGGRVRRAASDAERARVNVTRALGTVLKKIARDCPELGRLLEATVRTGVFCSYTPSPGSPVRWRT